MFAKIAPLLPEDEFDELINVGRNGGAGRKLTILQLAEMILNWKCFFFITVEPRHFIEK